MTGRGYPDISLKPAYPSCRDDPQSDCCTSVFFPNANPPSGDLLFAMSKIAAYARPLARTARSRAPVSARSFASQADSNNSSAVHFGLSDDQRAVQGSFPPWTVLMSELATSFARDVIIPVAAQYDKSMVGHSPTRSALIPGISMASTQTSALPGPDEHAHSCRGECRLSHG